VKFTGYVSQHNSVIQVQNASQATHFLRGCPNWNYFKTYVMNRKDFLKKTAIIGGASILTVNSVFSASIQESGMDKLTDAKGNLAL